MSELIKVTVPATSANMGPGFDCMGMAFRLYNHIYVEEREQGLSIDCRKGLPADETNLIYQTIQTFYDETGRRLPGLNIVQEDNIPITGGLGSSAACIVGGLLAANELSEAGLSREDLITMAARIEGHPDNSTPALIGGFIVGAMADGGLEYIRFVPPRLEELGFAVMTPDFQLATAKARSVLPKTVSMRDAVFNASRAALMTAALMSGDFSKLMTAMDDRLHQPYRMPFIPGMDGIFKKAGELGALGTFLSGAGSALIAVIDMKNSPELFITEMKNFFDTIEHSGSAGKTVRWTIRYLEPDLTGAVVSHI